MASLYRQLSIRSPAFVSVLGLGLLETVWLLRRLHEVFFGVSISIAVGLFCWVVVDESYSEREAEMGDARMDCFTDCTHGWRAIDDAGFDAVCPQHGFSRTVSLVS